MNKKERKEQCRQSFKTHIATISTYKDEILLNTMEVLMWKRPDTITCMIKYIISKNTLYVSGDLGKAIYQWSQDVTFEWIANCDLHYFKGKCEASEVGRCFDEWDGDLVIQELKRYAEEEEYFKWEDFEDHGGPGATYDQNEWHRWLEQDGYEVFGSDCYEWAPDLGSTTNTRCIYHFVGLQMAVKQMKENKKNFIKVKNE